MSHKKSNVTGRTWSTPFNTPFFIRWGEWNIKVPMEYLREEYNAWKEMQQRRPDSESPKPDPSPPFSSRPFDWAEDVEQALFSSASDLDSKPETDHVGSPAVDQAVPQVATGGRAGTTPRAASEVDEEGVTREDKAGAPKPTAPTASSNIDNTIYRIVNISATSDNLSIHMVEDASADTSHSTNVQKLSEAIQFLAGVGFLHLDNYAMVFEAVAARVCASGNPFWLKDPRCGYEVVV